MTTKNKYCVEVKMADESMDRPWRLSKSYGSPREAIRAVEMVMNTSGAFQFNRYEDFVFVEHGRRPFADIFVEKWNGFVWSRTSYSLAFVIGAAIAVLATLMGIVMSYAGGNPQDAWNIGFIVGFALMAASFVPALCETLKAVSDYNGIKDYLE
ncbi:MAG: hypothetical protein H9W81_08340 [Enterococcus sp.]|nr:hypothetical protein [Enterococcus sp.]